MSSPSDQQPVDPDGDTLAEYDFAEGVRGKYAARYAERTNLVALDPDVAAAFPTSEEVNRALRSLLQQSPPSHP